MSSNLLRCRTRNIRILRALTETIEVFGSCQWGCFSHSRCSTKFKRTAKHRPRKHGFWWAILPNEGNLSLGMQRIVRSGKVFPSLPFSWTLKRPAMNLPDLEIGVCPGCRYGLISPSNNCRFARYYWPGIVSALPRSSVTTATLATLLKITKSVEFSKPCSGWPIPSLFSSTTSARVPT